MKNRLKYIPLLGTLMLTGCLDLQPRSEIGEGDFYKNDSEVNVGVVACYNGMHAPLSNEWKLTDLRADVSRVRSRSSGTAVNKDLMSLDESTLYASHVEVEKYWNRTYHNIARCNTILRQSTLDVVADEKARKQYQGEALFIRSYHYFNLVRLYGPVFLVTERISAQEARTYDRSPVDEVYARIIGDLKQIVDEELLPDVYPAEAGRVTSWAAKTLLAKVYLTRGELTEAKKLLESVKGSDHDLLPEFADVFSIGNEMNEEIIFAIRYKAGNVGLGNPFVTQFAPLNSGSVVVDTDGEGYNYPTVTLMKAYQANGTDARKPVTVEEGYDDPIKGYVEDYYVTKYLSPANIKYDGEKDFPVLRYADVLLMLAEIENEQGNLATALGYLNQIRLRARIEPLTLTDVPNKYAMFLAIENERFLEFAYENHRFFDLVRTDRYIPVMDAHYLSEPLQYSDKLYYVDGTMGQVTRPLEEWQLLLPIPTSERDINPHITQNPGY
ncbi:MAG: RagB/SusD family nutrient uptake outer membrane protein [Bacteroides sp.]|nr:RagB/SusD family nutrient uptake outer membrane protein [Bacteroides sp.]